MIAHTSKSCSNFCNGANGTLKSKDFGGYVMKPTKIGITASDEGNVNAIRWVLRSGLAWLLHWLGYFVVPAHRRESERRTSGDALEMNIEEILDLG
jgi:hypothetical protein